MSHIVRIKISAILSCMALFLGACGEVSEKKTTSMALGNNYYMIVTQIQVPPRPASSSLSFTEDWDDLGSGAPDIFYEMTYKGITHYTSSVADDTIHASYSPIKAGIGKAIWTKNASQYLEGAVVNFYEEDAYVDYSIYDKDSATRNDFIGKMKIPFKMLQEGLNTFEEDGVTLSMVLINTNSDLNTQLKSLGLIQ